MTAESLLILHLPDLQSLSPAQHLQDLYADRDRMLQEIYELRRFKAAALCMIECLSEERPEGAVRV